MIIETMSDTDYHAHPYIGSTTAKHMLESRQLFKDAIDGIVDNGDKPHYAMGRLAHMMLLEPERFNKCITGTGPINPSTGKMYGRGTNKFSEWQAENPDVVVVEPELIRILERMPDEVKNIFAQYGKAEYSVFVDMDNGWGMKCRCDWLLPGHIYDYKTIDDINKCEKHISNLSYWLSSCWYRKVMEIETGIQHKHTLVFSEKTSPHRWRIYDLDEEYDQYAITKTNNIIMNIDYAYKFNKWTDESKVRHTADLPNYLIEKDYDYDTL